MKNLMKKLSISSMLVYTFALSASVASAQINTWGYTKPPKSVPKDIEGAIMNITNYILGFIAIIATLVIIYGGVRYLTAGGNEDNVAEAKKIIAAGVIGMVIAGLAYAMVIVVSTVIL